jgi:exonuclease SbcC
MSLEQDTLVTQIDNNRAALDILDADITHKNDQRQAWEDARTELQKLENERRLYQQEQMLLLERQAEIERSRAERPTTLQTADEARARLTELIAELSQTAGLEQQLADRRAEKTALHSEQDRLRKGMDDQVERIAQLGKDWLAMRDQAQPACPLCGQALTEEHQAAVLDRLRTEGKESGDRYRQNKARIGVLDEEIQSLQGMWQRRPQLESERESLQQRLARAEARVNEIEATLLAWDSGQAPEKLAQLTGLLDDVGRIDFFTAQISELEPIVRQLPDLQKERQERHTALITAEARLHQIKGRISEWEESERQQLTVVEKQLAEEDYAIESRAALREIDHRLVAVEYDESAHQSVREQRADLVDAPAQHEKLRSAEAAIKPLSASVADIDRRRGENQNRLSELEYEQYEAEQLLGELVAATADWQTLEAEVLRLRDDVAAAGRVVGAARQRVEVLQTLREQIAALTDQRRSIEMRVALLRELEEACGRRGVQALLIESALPEIEDHANGLLEQLTGGEMLVKFETQRELKTSGGQAETLEIKISDSSGERPYENYSGGEKFRVNFAIRLALSQVLAGRAGARLRMLVIDEGFGSQDQEGRQRLVEAINTIQSQFACILVITHIDELRDKFPVRIEVEKSSNGSQVNVIAA